MFQLYTLYQQPVWIMLILFFLIVWELVWKGIGLWFAAKHTRKGWFVAIFLLNTVGILPIIYLLWFNPTIRNNNTHSKRVVKKK